MIDWGGIVLCGGRSSRMGRPKAWLPFGPQTMLQRVVHCLRLSVGPVCVVAAPGQSLPAFPPDVLIAHDETEGLGPLAGLAAGLKTLEGKCTAAFATSCDVPFLQVRFVQAVCARLGDHDVVTPVEADFCHPLAAVYRTLCARKIDLLLQEGKRRPADLFTAVPTSRIPVDELRSVDPPLASLRNLNDPQAYLAALREAGFDAPTGEWTETVEGS